MPHFVEERELHVILLANNQVYDPESGLSITDTKLSGNVQHYKFIIAYWSSK